MILTNFDLLAVLGGGMTSENMEIVGLLAALASCGFLLYLAYSLVIKSEIRNLPTISDGKEQDAFHAWATTQGLDTNWHSEQQLFLDPRTIAAREAWKAAIAYCRKQALQSKVAENCRPASRRDAGQEVFQVASAGHAIPAEPQTTESGARARNRDRATLDDGRILQLAAGAMASAMNGSKEDMICR
jgi:hypothetical protein